MCQGCWVVNGLWTLHLVYLCTIKLKRQDYRLMLAVYTTNTPWCCHVLLLSIVPLQVSNADEEDEDEDDEDVEHIQLGDKVRTWRGGGSDKYSTFACAAVWCAFMQLVRWHAPDEQQDCNTLLPPPPSPACSM